MDGGQPVTSPAALDTLLQPYHAGDVVSFNWTAIHGATHTTHTTQITLGNGPFR